MKKRWIRLSLSLVGVFILLFLISISTLVSSPIKKYVEMEAGEEIRESCFYRNSKLHQFLESYSLDFLNVKILTKFQNLSLNKVGNIPIQFLVNGKTMTSVLRISDSKSPRMEIKDVVMVAGEMPKEEDFIEMLEDETELNLRIKGLKKYKKKKKPGIYKVEIEAVDSAGNKTSKTGYFYALSLKKRVKAELGSKSFSASSFLKNKKQNLKIKFRNDFDVKPSLEYVGKYTIPLTVKVDGKEKEIDLTLEVEDTKKNENYRD